MAEHVLPNYEVPELLVYGAFRDLTQLDWSLGIYPTPKVLKKKRKKRKQRPRWGGCQVSGFGSSYCSSYS